MAHRPVVEFVSSSSHELSLIHRLRLVAIVSSFGGTLLAGKVAMTQSTKYGSNHTPIWSPPSR